MEAVHLDIEALRVMIDLALDRGAAADDTNLRACACFTSASAASPSWRTSPSTYRAVGETRKE
jgi:alpha-D-ribose 1-methylphosphonate 5-triphosphate synthase subunit PhnL